MFTHVDHGIELPKITRKTTEKGRKYFTPDGKAYPSATTVLSILNKEAILAWRKRVGDAEANKISSQASRRGTAVHTLCEDYIDNVPEYTDKHMPANIMTFNTLKPLLDKHIDNVYFQEAFLYSDILKCAGQVDCIAEYDGELSIIDFKTSRRVKKEKDILNYFMQMSFYAAAFYERTKIPVKNGVIIMSVDDSEPSVFKIDSDDYLPHFKAVRESYGELYER